MTSRSMARFLNDEITIDLWANACGVSYEAAALGIEWQELDGVRIPFASARLLWQTKRTYPLMTAAERRYYVRKR